MILAWVTIGQVLLPILVGVLAVALAPRWPRLGAYPLATALGLYVLLIVITALASPGGDLWMPFIGGLVSTVVAIAAFASLRRQKSGTA